MIKHDDYNSFAANWYIILNHRATTDLSVIIKSLIDSENPAVGNCGLEEKAEATFPERNEVSKRLIEGSRYYIDMYEHSRFAKSSPSARAVFFHNLYISLSSYSVSYI